MIEDDMDVSDFKIMMAGQPARYFEELDDALRMYNQFKSNGAEPMLFERQWGIVNVPSAVPAET